MKKYIFTLIALSMIFTATARKPKNTRTTEAAAREIAAADSLRLVASRQAALIDSLQNLVAVAEQRDETAESETAAPDPVVDPEQAAADSVAALRLRLRPTKIESIFDTNGLTVLDTLATENDAVQVILYSNNSWKYVLNREVAKDSTIFEKYWDTTTLFPYKEVDMSEMPKSVVIDLVDSLTSYHCPYQGSVHPRGKYGPRRRRQHQGVDLPLKTGDPVYATFCGRVRISQYNRGGYGNLVIIRHDNGLETYYGHLSERLVEPDQWRGQLPVSSALWTSLRQPSPRRHTAAGRRSSGQDVFPAPDGSLRGLSRHRYPRRRYRWSRRASPRAVRCRRQSRIQRTE